MLPKKSDIAGKQVYFHQDFVDVIELLEAYLQEKTNNLQIQAWYRLKSNSDANDLRRSLQTFSKSNSIDIQNIMPLTTKRYDRKGKNQRFETGENQRSMRQCEMPSYEIDSIEKYSKCELDQEFQDIVLEKLQLLENQIAKLRFSRAKSITEKSRSREFQRKNNSRVLSYKKSSQVYNPKYTPMSSLMEKLEIKDITNLIQQQQNYSIPQSNDKNSIRSSGQNYNEPKNYLSDRQTPAFKSRGEFEKNRNSEIWNSHYHRESTTVHPFQYEHQKTLDQLYKGSQPAINLSKIHEKDSYCKCSCKSCNLDEFPLVKTVNANSISPGFYRLVPYKFQEYQKNPESTDRTKVEKTQRPPPPGNKSRIGVASSFKTLAVCRNSFQTFKANQ